MNGRVFKPMLCAACNSSQANTNYSYCSCWWFLFLIVTLFCRLTDPIPTTETSIAPRQRPKAGQTQPNPGILPIQPALTPRKRPTAQAAIQPQGETPGCVMLYCWVLVHADHLTDPFSPTNCRACCPGQWSAFTPCKCPSAKSSTATNFSAATSQAGVSTPAGITGTAPGPLCSATSHTSAPTAAFLEAAATATAAAAAGCVLPAAAGDASSAGEQMWQYLLCTSCAR